MIAFSYALPVKVWNGWKIVSKAPPRASLRADVDIAIVGGGIGGLAAAAALRRAGRCPVVLEAGAAPAREGQALSLWTNGWRALEALGADCTELRKSFRNDEVTILRTQDGTTLRSTRFPSSVEMRYVMRPELLDALVKLLPSDVVRYDSRVTTVKPDTSHATVTLADGTPIRARAVVCADGVRSVARTSREPRVARYVAWRGSARADLDLLPPGRVLQVWGAGERLGATRVREDIVHWFYTAPPPHGIDINDADAQLSFVRERVAQWNCTVASLVAESKQTEFAVTRLGDRLQWTPGEGASGALTLLGDAAHLSTPNLGQGAALALEDAVELGYRISKAARGASVSSALRSYELARFRRNLDVGVRSAAAGALVHFAAPPFVWVRDTLLVQVLASPAVMLSTTRWKPPS